MPSTVAVGQQADGPGLRRQLAPGVVTVIPALPEERDTVTGPRPLTELLDRQADLQWQPQTFASQDTLAARAQEVYFRRSLWQLEFGFKPLRVTRAELPTADGRRESVVVWYLMYYVRNPGHHLRPVPTDQDVAATRGVYQIQKANRPLRLVPTFYLQGHDRQAVYREGIWPQLVQQIGRREAPGEAVYDSVSISQVQLPASDDPEQEKVWGVATWTGVEPGTSYLSVLAQGLTNAYQWQVQADGTKVYQYRTLQLNFWRPGDRFREEEDRVYYGMPFFEDLGQQQRVLDAFSLPERLNYRWVYR